MKVTVVPAQVTTVEDRVAGNLGLNQLMLLSAPLFGGSVLYVVLPPFFSGDLYKLITICILFVVFGVLAIRVKGKIALLWLIVFFRYYLRPKYFVFDKRSVHGRAQYSAVISEVLECDRSEVAHAPQSRSALSPTELMLLNDLIEKPNTTIRFELNKKGSMYVHFTEAKSEN